MKKEYKVHILILLLAFVALWLLSSCKSKIVYVPTETVRTEYVNKYLRDSIHYYDSIFVKEKGDTLLIEKYKYIYRDRIETDTVLKTDSIQVLYPVTEYREINRLNSLQSFQIWCGRILLLLLVGYVGFRTSKRFR